jgi:outer membrane protein assembly factor BamB
MAKVIVERATVFPWLGLIVMVTAILIVAGRACSQSETIREEVQQFSATGAKKSGQANDTDKNGEWNQWRGPERSGMIRAKTWPTSISGDRLKQVWSVRLAPSYSGPIVVGDRVYTTETKDKRYEVVSAFDRLNGKLLWSTKWEGSMSVPFFARANGDWIRSTPIVDNDRIYVGGMRDVLVCLNIDTGNEIWKVDFPQMLGSAVPSFGFVCSPMIDGEYLYVQAGGAFCKLNKSTGTLIWKSLEDGGGMYGSAFSSPVIAEIAGVRQAVVQSRTHLSGVELETGKVLWTFEIPAFRGMNIITPIVQDNHLFVSAYGGTTQWIQVIRTESGEFKLSQVWNLPAQGYMNSPIVIDGHVYMHLRNQRFACYDLATGRETWRSKPMGKYASMIVNGDKILALDERGELLLIRTNPKQFELLSSRTVGDDSWAHLAIRGNQIFVRNLNELVAFEWQSDESNKN